VSAETSRCADIFLTCAAAALRGELIRRASRQDKEFAFQDWFRGRLEGLAATGLRYDQRGRNAYPDFILVQPPEGYEIKGLAWPGREATYDANSQVPTGVHNGRAIFYVFGRYPAEAGDNEYPVIDLVICHGDILNAHHDYVHQNKSVRGFGSYGDILIRDRKMYVAPTPFALARHTTGQRTLIVPEDFPADPRLEPAGRLVRVESERLVTGYTFDLTTNELSAAYTPNPFAGREHAFVAYRVAGNGGPTVTLAATPDNDTGDEEPPE
jgi:hypothetical protein